MGKLFLGMQDPLAPDKVDVVKWEAFLDALGAEFLVIVAITIVVIAVAYSFAARRRKIHAPGDLFEPYLPMALLSLALVGTAAVGVAAYLLHQNMIGESVPGGLTAASHAGVEALVLSFIGGYLTMLIPGVTPAKFRYRPVSWFIRGRGARA